MDLAEDVEMENQHRLLLIVRERRHDLRELLSGEPVDESIDPLSLLGRRSPLRTIFLRSFQKLHVYTT